MKWLTPALVLLLTSNATAQITSRPLPVPPAPYYEPVPADPNTSPGLVLPEWIYVATAGADWAVAPACNRLPCTGHLRAMYPYFGASLKPAAAVPLGLAMDAGILALIHYVLPREHRQTWGVVALYTLATVRGVIVTHRVADLRRNAVRRAR